MSKTLASHYGENWTDEDKRMFDALVKEEMMKVERGFQSNGSIEEKSTRQVPGLYERNSPQSQETNSNGSLTFFAWFCFVLIAVII